MNRFTRLLAVTGITGALALGATGVAAAAGPNQAPQQSRDRVTNVKDVKPSVDRNSSRDHSKKDRGGKHDSSSKDHGKKHERSSRR